MILAKESYLISLERRPDRRDRALRELGEAQIGGVNVFPAFDGRAAGLVSPQSYSGRHVAQTTMSLGEVGCYLSHLSLWKQARARGLSSMAIFEDDIKFVPESHSRLQQFLKDVPADWDILHFGHMHRYTPTVLPIGTVMRLNFTWCLQMMIYRKRAIDVLLADQRTEAVIRPIDDIICLHMHELKCYGPFPHIAVQSGDVSDLG